MPAHITVDTEAATAHWFGVFESETVSLADALVAAVAVVALGVARRAGARGRALVVHEPVEDLVDHAEVALRVGVLPLHVDQVVRQPVEARRRRAQHGERGTGPLGEEADRVVDDAHLDVARRPAPSRSPACSSTAAISPNTAPGVSIRANGDAVVLDDDLSGDEHEHAARRAPRR